MKAVKGTRTSPMKGNPADGSGRLFDAIELKSKDLARDFKGWNQDLPTLNLSIDKLEKATRNEIVLKSQELNDEFLDTNTKLVKINKAVEASQKKLRKTQSEFDKKLLTPYDKGSFASQTAAVLNEVKLNIQKIQGILNANMKLLDEVAERCLALTQRLAKLEDTVTKICLPEHVEDAVKLSEKLNDRITALCQETAALQVGPQPLPQQFDPKKICGSFLLLYNAHRTGEKLLDQVQKNLTKVDPAAAAAVAGPAIVPGAAAPDPQEKNAEKLAQ